jgi:hypothetical protein
LTFDRISINPSICRRQAWVKRTRMPVHQMACRLANGDGVEALPAKYAFSVPRGYHGLSLDCTAGLAGERVTPIEVANL